MTQFSRTVFCHLQAVLMAVGVTGQRRARNRKVVHRRKFSNTLFKAFNGKVRHLCCAPIEKQNMGTEENRRGFWDEAQPV